MFFLFVINFYAKKYIINIKKRLTNLLANRQHEQQLVAGNCRGGVGPPMQKNTANGNPLRGKPLVPQRQGDNSNHTSVIFKTKPAPSKIE